MAADTVSAAIPATTTGAMMGELAEKQLYFTEHNDTVQPIEIGLHMYSQEESRPQQPGTGGTRLGGPGAS